MEKTASLALRALPVLLDQKALLVRLERPVLPANEDPLVLLVLPAHEVFKEFRVQPVRLDRRD